MNLYSIYPILTCAYFFPKEICEENFLGYVIRYEAKVRLQQPTIRAEPSQHHRHLKMVTMGSDRTSLWIE